MIQELEEVSRIDRVVHKLCMEFATRRVVWEGLPGCTGRGNGITVLFLCTLLIMMLETGRSIIFLYEQSVGSWSTKRMKTL